MLKGPKQDDNKKKMPDEWFAKVMKVWDREAFGLPPNEVAERKQFLYLE